MIEFNLLTSNTPACAIQVGPSGSNRVDFLFFLLMKHESPKTNQNGHGIIT